MTMKHRVIAVTGLGAVGLAGVGLAAGVALADPGTAKTPRATASPSAAAPATGQDKHQDKHKARGILDTKRVLHGEFVVTAKGGSRVVDVQRGTVTTVSTASVSLKSSDGFTGTYAVSATVRVRKSGAKADIAAVKVGDAVVVVATKLDGAVTARSIVVGTKPQK